MPRSFISTPSEHSPSIDFGARVELLGPLLSRLYWSIRGKERPSARLGHLYGWARVPLVSDAPLQLPGYTTAGGLLQATGTGGGVNFAVAGVAQNRLSQVDKGRSWQDFITVAGLD